MDGGKTARSSTSRVMNGWELVRLDSIGLLAVMEADAYIHNLCDVLEILFHVKYMLELKNNRSKHL